MNTTKNWYALCVKTNCGKKVIGILKRKEIEMYYPLIQKKDDQQINDRKKISLEPLFTSFIFIYVHELELNEIKKISGVANIMYWLGKPAIIKSDEINTIKSFLDTHDNIQLEQTKINVKHNMRAVAASIISVKESKIKTHLPSLGYALVADVERPKTAEPIKESVRVYQLYSNETYSKIYS